MIYQLKNIITCERYTFIHNQLLIARAAGFLAAAGEPFILTNEAGLKVPVALDPTGHGDPSMYRKACEKWEREIYGVTLKVFVSSNSKEVATCLLSFIPIGIEERAKFDKISGIFNDAQWIEIYLQAMSPREIMRTQIAWKIGKGLQEDKYTAAK